jgi:transposase
LARRACGRLAGCPSQLAALLIEARDAAAAARQAGQAALDAAIPGDLLTRYRALATAGLAANLCRRTATAMDARRLARRFLRFEDMILRFATPRNGHAWLPPGLEPA